MMNKSKKDSSVTESLLSDAQRMRYRLVLEGALVGVFAGAVSIFYRLALHDAESAMRFVLGYAEGNPLVAIIWFLALAVMAFAVWMLVQTEPMISGSGIPQIEGELMGFLDQSWYRSLCAKILGGILCIFGGLSLGREGPSIQLGGLAGKGVSKVLNRNGTEEHHLITCGACAGLAAAFNAPLAGILFALEEIHKSFSVAILFSAMTASVTADFLSKYVFGLEPVFHFTVNSAIPLVDYWMILLLGVILGLLGAFYNRATLFAQTFYIKLFPKRTYFRFLVPFLTAGVLGFTLPQVLGSGHYMIDLLTEGNLALSAILILLAGKFLFSLVSFGSGAPGGIFFPLLVMGCFIGGAFGLTAVELWNIDPSLVSNFIILAMAGFFTAIVRAPITGIVLISEMTGSLSHLLALSVVSIAAYVTADLLRTAPIYESLLNRLLKKEGIIEGKDSISKALVQQVVQPGSIAANRLVSEIQWPEGCLLVEIKRGREERIPKGDTKIFPGDVLTALTDTEDVPMMKHRLRNLCFQDEESIPEMRHASSR